MRHEVYIHVQGHRIEGWQGYAITVDITSFSDTFDLTIAAPTRDLYELCRPDSEVDVFIDDVKVLNGFIGKRHLHVSRGQGTQLTISGRDRAGRLVDESMPLTTFDGLTLEDLARAAVRPWFPSVVFSNARNRALLRGRRAEKAAARGEPPIAARNPHAQRKVDPGESRAQVLQHWLAEARLLGWASADGREFIIGLPNYSQEPQFVFFAPRPNSDRAEFGNLLSWDVEDSVDERYSQIIAYGAFRGDSANYSRSVMENSSIAKNGPGPDGIGRDFQHRKVLIISDDGIKNRRQAQEVVDREMAQRDSTGRVVRAQAKGHAQAVNTRSTPALFAPDLVSLFVEEATGQTGRYLVTGVTYRGDRSASQITDLVLVPEGTVLTQ
jgi:prophage tail gpP-like protein